MQKVDKAAEEHVPTGTKSSVNTYVEDETRCNSDDDLQTNSSSPLSAKNAAR